MSTIAAELLVSVVVITISEILYPSGYYGQALLYFLIFGVGGSFIPFAVFSLALNLFFGRLHSGRYKSKIFIQYIIGVGLAVMVIAAMATYDVMFNLSEMDCKMFIHYIRSEYLFFGCFALLEIGINYFLMPKKDD